VSNSLKRRSQNWQKAGYKIDAAQSIYTKGVCISLCVYMYICIYEQFGKVLKTVNSAQKYAKLKQTQHNTTLMCIKTNITHTPRLNLHCYQTAVADASWGMARTMKKAARQPGKQQRSTWQLFLVPLGVCVT